MEAYNDPRWMTFSQIKAANYKLNNAKGKGVHWKNVLYMIWRQKNT